MHNKTAELNGTVETTTDRPFISLWNKREELQSDTSGQSAMEYLGCGCGLTSVKQA